MESLGPVNKDQFAEEIWYFFANLWRVLTSSNQGVTVKETSATFEFE